MLTFLVQSLPGYSHATVLFTVLMGTGKLHCSGMFLVEECNFSIACNLFELDHCIFKCVSPNFSCQNTYFQWIALYTKKENLYLYLDVGTRQTKWFFSL